MEDEDFKTDNPEEASKSDRPGWHVIYETMRGTIADIFFVALFFYFTLLCLESVKKGYVSFFFNPNYLLLITAVSGILYALTGGEERGVSAKERITTVDATIMAVLGILGALIIWYKTSGLGTISYFLSIGAGILIVCILFIINQPGET